MLSIRAVTGVAARRLPKSSGPSQSNKTSINPTLSSHRPQRATIVSSIRSSLISGTRTNHFSTSSTSSVTISDDATTYLRTIRDYIRFVTSHLRNAKVAFGQGSTSATEDAIWLVLGSLNLPLHSADTDLFLDANLTPQETSTILKNLRRRVEDRVPTGYITNRAVFVIAEILTHEDELPAILPEDLTPLTIKRCLDVCTGSAALALILADIFPRSKVDGIDISTDALEVAKRNVKEFDAADRVQLIHSDMFASIEKGTKYEIIVSNPPYVTQKSMDALPEEFRKEPSLALFGGDDGLQFVETLIKQAPLYLSDNGVLIVEGGKQRRNLEKKFPDIPFRWLPTSVGDEDVFMIHKADLKPPKAASASSSSSSASKMSSAPGNISFHQHAVPKKSQKHKTRKQNDNR